MSYFKQQLGKRPEAPTANDAAQVIRQPTVFCAQLGARHITQSQAMICPLCRADISKAGAIYCCTGRCATRYIYVDSCLLAITTLPVGPCDCCDPACALTPTESGAICPTSNEPYLLLPTGPRRVAQAAPAGLCHCCAPPAPLLQREGALICSARPTNQYRVVQGKLRLLAVSQPNAAAIDAALRRNIAQVTVNGLFDLSETDPSR